MNKLKLKTWTDWLTDWLTDHRPLSKAPWRVLLIKEQTLNEPPVCILGKRGALMFRYKTFTTQSFWQVTDHTDVVLYSPFAANSLAFGNSSCNPCQSSPSLIMLASLMVYYGGLVVFYLGKLLFLGFFQFKAYFLLWEEKLRWISFICLSVSFRC